MTEYKDIMSAIETHGPLTKSDLVDVVPGEYWSGRVAEVFATAGQLVFAGKLGVVRLPYLLDNYRLANHDLIFLPEHSDIVDEYKKSVNELTIEMLKKIGYKKL